MHTSDSLFTVGAATSLWAQGWGSKIIDTKQKFPRKGESLLESAQAAAAQAMSALHPDAAESAKT